MEIARSLRGKSYTYTLGKCRLYELGYVLCALLILCVCNDEIIVSISIPTKNCALQDHREKSFFAQKGVPFRLISI